MNEQAVLERTRSFVQAQMAPNDTGHDYLHVQRVVALVKDIAAYEPECQPFLVEMVALLHDIDDYKLRREANALSAFVEQLSISAELKQQILTCCGYIAYSKYPKPDPRLPLEARIVQDADRLDALGAVGIARTFAYGGAKKHPFYGEGENTVLGHFAQKLCRLSESLNTPRAKEIAVQRQVYLNGFVEQFNAELNREK